MKSKVARCNEQITHDTVMVIDHNGESCGIVPTSKALTIARDADLDLVEVSPHSSPVVCKVMDYGKYRYEQQKKHNETKKKQKIISIKEVKIRPNIATADYQVKLRNARRFIGHGDKVRVTLMFRGREAAHEDIGFKLIQKFCDDMDDIAKSESPPKKEGRNIFLLLIPKNSTQES